MIPRVKAGAVIVLTFFASACTTAARKDVAFSSASPEAMVVVGTASGPPQRYTLTLSTYDAEHLRVTSSSFTGQYLIAHKERTPATVEYHVLTLPPGRYVIKSVQLDNPVVQTVICLAEGTSSFEAKAGELVYIGNITLAGGEVGRAGFDDAAAAAAMEEYPNVHREIVRGTLVDATFRNGKDLLGAGKVCGGYYVD